MKEIQLSRGLATQVDDEDYDFLMQWKWYAHLCDGNNYARRSHNKSDGVEKRGCVFMHTVIINTPKGYVTDHIDGNGLNNQRSNLRVCTNAENIRNSKSRVGSTSKYLGVRIQTQKYKKRDGTVSCYRSWSAVIHTNRKHIFLGCHKTEEEAALAYNEAAKKHFGEFVRLNIIEEKPHDQHETP